MNYPLLNVPERPAKPRQKGLTMVMDKGLSLRQVEDFIEVAKECCERFCFSKNTFSPSAVTCERLSAASCAIAFMFFACEVGLLRICHFHKLDLFRFFLPFTPPQSSSSRKPWPDYPQKLSRTLNRYA